MADATQTTATPASAGVTEDPYRAYNFKLSIDTLVSEEQGHFTRVEGLGVRIPRILYREGGNHTVVRSIPGPAEYATVTLRYGVTSSRALVDWLFRIVEGTIQRHNVSIIMLGDTGAEVRRWNLIDAWPCEWYGVPLDAMSQELAIESLSLAYDQLVIPSEDTTTATPA